jgi:hypothetical protein
MTGTRCTPLERILATSSKLSPTLTAWKGFLLAKSEKEGEEERNVLEGR